MLFLFLKKHLGNSSLSAAEISVMKHCEPIKTREQKAISRSTFEMITHIRKPIKAYAHFVKTKK